jgi:hypothetical protein|tara:strand:+ start:252 stop:2246 length:1995 start_codon:yes stop_codon:yes gene_type:complete
MASSKPTEEELVTRIRGEITDSLGYLGDTISKQREQAMQYYYGLPFGNEVAGRSQFVDTTVADTIEWIKPSLMRIFASGDNMVTFEPHGPEDVDAAKQATDYVNYVFQKDNDGWEILYSWFTDALLSKNGIVKVWWDETEKWNREEYKNLTEDELAILLNDSNVEVVEHTPPGESDEGYSREITEGHSIVIKRDLSQGRVVVEPVPPSEFLIARESKTIADAKFVCHRVIKTLSELREMYPDKNLEVEDLKGGSDDMASFSGERLERFMYDKSAKYWEGWGGDDTYGEDGLRTYWLHESYLKTDFDGDGITELRKVCTVGSTVLANEEIDRIPFVSITPIKIPHKFFGLSVADLVMDLQLIKSTLLRNLMDNMYNQNFGRYAVLEGQANLDDLLTQRPGGVVRVKSPNAIMPLATPPLEPYSFQMLEYIDGIRESRAGVSKYSQGLNDNALTSHTTATAVNSVMTAAQSRVELIARNFAETGVKQLMLAIYELLQKNQDKERVIKLRNEWIPVRPDMWRDKMDCTVAVGLGHGNKDQQLMHLTSMLQFASEAMSGGLSIVTEKNMYNMGAAMLKNMGFQNVQDFLTDPEQLPPQQDEGPSTEEQMAQMDMQLKQKELEIKAADVQVKMQKIQQEAKKDAVDAQLKVQELNLEREQQRAVAIGDT